MTACKRCLLLEAGKSVTYDEISKYIASIKKEELVSEKKYIDRITRCKSCENLISGMCLKCGCYVEVRARLQDAHCPHDREQRW